MKPGVALTKIINSYDDLQKKFNLVPTNDPNFFPEWYDNLPQLSEQEKQQLDRIKQRYKKHSFHGLLTEATVLLLMISPLLELAGFYDAPFMIRGEDSVEIELENQPEVLKGRIDVIVVKDELWILVIEAKNTQLYAGIAIPQCMAYMMKSSQDKPIFGLVTNGEEFMLIKLIKEENQAQYDISRVFSLLPQRNELYELLGVLKKIGSYQ